MSVITMRTHNLLTLFLVLCGGIPPGLRAMDVYSVTEGRNITIKFLVYEESTERYFCKNDCDYNKNILVKSSATKTQESKGRYSIQYNEHAPPPHVMHVSITNVVSSDSGTYTCETWSKATEGTKEVFQINVTTATKSPDSATASSTLTSLLYYVTSPPPTFSSEVYNVTGTEARDHLGPSSGSPSTRTALYVSLPAVLILLSVTLAVLYWRKTIHKPTGNAPPPESNHLYEEIPDVNKSATVYSLLSQPQAHTQAEDGSYTEVFSTKCSSAPRCQPGTNTSAGQTEVYSTID